MPTCRPMLTRNPAILATSGSRIVLSAEVDCLSLFISTIFISHTHFNLFISTNGLIEVHAL